MNTKRKTFQSNSAARFHKDFAPLERSLKRQKQLGALMVTPEMIIVELNLTPEKIRRIKTEVPTYFRWFDRTYAALGRHGLLPNRKIAWDEWLKQYEAKKAGFRTKVAKGQKKNPSKTKRRGRRAGL